MSSERQEQKQQQGESISSERQDQKQQQGESMSSERQDQKQQRGAAQALWTSGTLPSSRTEGSVQ